MADRFKLAAGLRNLPETAREDLAGREQDIQRGKTVELLRRAGKEMYENPIVNTAIGLSPVLGDIQAGVEAYRSAQAGDWGNAGLNAVGMLPFIPMLGKTVWHGSPHSFEKFDLSKIGTGEGAQAYGHGLYLAESPDVAKGYQQSTSGSASKAVNASYSQDPELWVAGQIHSGIPKQDIAEGLQTLGYKGDANKLIEQGANRLNAELNVGSLYKVDLPDEQIAKMLDWDNPITEEMRKPISQAMMEKFGSGLSMGSGEQAYKQIVDEFKFAGSENPKVDATRWMVEQGVPGIQYLDQASRGAGEGTRNYVVFSDEIPQILERNGQPVAQALRNYEAPKQSTLQDVVSPIEQRGVTLDVYESNKKPLMTLSRIEVPKEMRGQGVGTQAMQDLVNYANQQGKTIALSPSTDFGGTSVNRLKDFYKQFGFVENKGRNKDFEISESMYRLPETE